MNEGIGEVDIFVVPIARTPDARYRYQAVFA
jgi:hypothetical protein